MRKRACKKCGRSITRSHGKAIYCKDCSYERQLASARAWWKRNKYSEVIARRRYATEEVSKFQETEKPERCRDCGKKRQLVGHHENYSETRVVWLCRICHSFRHRNAGTELSPPITGTD